VSLALDDVIPHIIIQSLHLRVREPQSHLAKRLLQQYQGESGSRSDIAKLSRMTLNGVRQEAGKE
jgi:hypothetical protein